MCLCPWKAGGLKHSATREVLHSEDGDGKRKAEMNKGIFHTLSHLLLYCVHDAGPVQHESPLS